MSITECFSMRKRRSVEKTPGRSQCEYAGKLRRTPRRFPANNNSSFHDQSLEIIWDNNSPSPGRTLSLGKRKKHGSDSSSSGGEISDLVQKLAEKSGNTPEANPPLLAFWMARDNKTDIQRRNTSPANDSETEKQKEKEFQTPARRPRRVLRKCNKTKMKLLKQEIEMLAYHIEEPDGEPPSIKETSTESSKKRESCLAPESITGTNEQENSHTTAKTIKDSSKSRGDFLESCSNDFFESWDNDEDDLILSQVDISSLCKEHVEETQVMTNTQYLDGGNNSIANCVRQEPPLQHHSMANIDSNESIVSESWDFADDLGDSGDESILQTALEDFERSQSSTFTRVPTVQRLVHLAPMLELDIRQPSSDQQTDETPARKNICTALRPTGNNSLFERQTLPAKGLDKTNIKFSFVPRSSFKNATAESCENRQAQHQKERNILGSGEMLSVNNIQHQKRTAGGHTIHRESCVQLRSEDIPLAGSSTESRRKSTEPDHLKTTQVKYSKEDIERKKMEAQLRRRQKMAMSLQNLV